MDFDLTWVRQGSQSMVSLESKTITLVFFDQFSIKKGLDGGFLKLRNRLEPLTIRKFYQKYGKNEKNWHFLTKKRYLKYSPNLCRRC